MLRAISLCLGLLALLAGPSGAQAQQTVKIGVILPYSGQFADTGMQLDNGIKLYMQQHGDTVAGKKIEVIRKDVGGIAPEVAKRLAQELVVRDNADGGGVRRHANEFLPAQEYFVRNPEIVIGQRRHDVGRAIKFCLMKPDPFPSNSAYGRVGRRASAFRALV